MFLPFSPISSLTLAGKLWINVHFNGFHRRSCYGCESGNKKPFHCVFFPWLRSNLASTVCLCVFCTFFNTILCNIDSYVSEICRSSWSKAPINKIHTRKKKQTPMLKLYQRSNHWINSVRSSEHFIVVLSFYIYITAYCSLKNEFMPCKWCFSSLLYTFKMNRDKYK